MGRRSRKRTRWRCRTLSRWRKRRKEILANAEKNDKAGEEAKENTAKNQ